MGCVEKCGSNVVRSSSFGRKRVLPNGGGCTDNTGGGCKKQCFLEADFCTGKSSLENLPHEILNRIVCGVEHDDLKNLFLVSKTIREIALLAKQTHFAYSTPRKTLGGFKEMENWCDLEEIAAPNAPKQLRIRRSKLSGKKLADISVALFKDLVLETQTGNSVEVCSD